MKDEQFVLVSTVCDEYYEHAQLFKHSRYHFYCTICTFEKKEYITLQCYLFKKDRFIKTHMTAIKRIRP